MKPATFDVAVCASSARTPRVRGGSRRDVADRYLDELGQLPRLTAEQEHARLLRLRTLRRARWETLLAEPQRRVELLARLEAELDEPPAELLDRARAHDDGTDASSDAVVALSVALEAVDTDGQLLHALAGHELPRADAERRLEIRRALERYQRARNRFVCANLRLVVSIAGRYSGRFMSLADRIQEGNLGLLKAVERFDPDRGTRFSTYAVWWIRHAIKRALVNRGRTVRVPAHLHVVFNKLRGARAAVEAQLGRPATISELAEAAGVPLDKAEASFEAMELRSVSLEGSDDDDGRPWPEALGQRPPQARLDALLDQRRNETVALQALEQLDQREHDILCRRFELAGCARMTLHELGARHGVSRERVRQLQNRALANLRHEVEAHPSTTLAFA